MTNNVWFITGAGRGMGSGHHQGGAGRCAAAVAGVGAVVWPMVRRAKHERATE